MRHVLELTDEQYETLQKVAGAQGQTPEALVAAWLEEIRDQERSPSITTRPTIGCGT